MTVDERERKLERRLAKLSAGLWLALIATFIIYLLSERAQ